MNPIRIGLVVVAMGFTALGACGQNDSEKGSETPTTAELADRSATPEGYNDLASWEPLSASAQIDATRAAIVITTSAANLGYQAGANVSTAGSRSLTVHYDISVQGGESVIGVMRGDRSAWLGTFPLPGNGRTTLENTVDVGGQDEVVIVFTTDEASTPSPTYTLHNVSYRLE